MHLHKLIYTLYHIFTLNKCINDVIICTNVAFWGDKMKFDVPFNSTCAKSYRISDIENFGNISVIEVGYNQTPPKLRQVMQRDVFILHYITKGKGTFMNKAFDRNYGYIVYPNELEIVESDKECPYEAYWIMFTGTSASEILEKCNFPKHNGVFLFDENEECSEILKDIMRNNDPKSAFEEGYIMQSALYKIFSIHMRKLADNRSSTTIEAYLKNYIEHNYNREIKIASIAKMLNYNRSHLYKKFSSAYGISPKKYLLNYRIEMSKPLLSDRTRKLSVAEAAYMVGFNNPLYFSRIFKQITGLAPSTYRKKNQA